MSNHMDLHVEIHVATQLRWIPGQWSGCCTGATALLSLIWLAKQLAGGRKLPSVGIETRTSGSSGQCLTNWARQESVGQEISEVSFVCFMHHFTCWTLFISRINRAWLYKSHEDSGWQLNADLAQLVRHWPEDPEVLVSNPTEGQFLTFFFALPCVKICQIIWQKCLSWKTQ